MSWRRSSPPSTPSILTPIKKTPRSTADLTIRDPSLKAWLWALSMDEPTPFLILERIGEVVAYDICDVKHPRFETYFNRRDFQVDNAFPDLGAAGDISPESIAFVDKKDSPTGSYLLLLANSGSGTVSVYEISGSNTEPCSSAPSLAPHLVGFIALCLGFFMLF